jgi:hypothetical protein
MFSPTPCTCLNSISRRHPECFQIQSFTLFAIKRLPIWGLEIDGHRTWAVTICFGRGLSSLDVHGAGFNKVGSEDMNRDLEFDRINRRSALKLCQTAFRVYLNNPKANLKA